MTIGHRDVARTLQLGGVRLNLPVFPWLKGNVLLLFTSGKGRMVSVAIRNFQRTTHSLVSSIYYRPYLLGLEQF